MQSFRFGEKVQIIDIADYTKCAGNVRNHLGLGYYRVDNIWCDYKTPQLQGRKPMPSMLVSENHMILFWWQTHCALGYCYTPVIGNGEIPQIEECMERAIGNSNHYKQKCIYKQYFNLEDKWVDAT